VAGRTSLQGAEPVLVSMVLLFSFSSWNLLTNTWFFVEKGLDG
jgi:hypothetical protein